MSIRLGIIADDLSGAADSGLQFARLGRRTVVLFTPDSDSAGADVIVVDADSRGLPAAEAASAVRASIDGLRRAGCSRLYKKIDSTLRGNLGAELDALLDLETGVIALVSPAFASAGRAVRDGRLLVRGWPLEETEFARDPLWPATDSRVAAVIGRQTSLSVAAIGIEDVRAGEESARTRLEALIGGGARVVVADAETVEDLGVLGALVAGDARLVGVGSAGLAGAIAAALGWEADSREASLTVAEANADDCPCGCGAGERPTDLGHFPTPRQRGSGLGGSATPTDRRDTSNGGRSPNAPVLAVVGSLNPVALGQLDELHTAEECAIVALDVASLLANPAGSTEGAAERAASEITAALAVGRSATLTLRAAGSTGTSSAAATRVLLAALGRAARLALAEPHAVAGLFLSGGDTAKAVCSALGATGLVVEREVAPGIPQGRLVGGRLDGTPVVTKAGGFGERDAIVQAARVLRRVGS